jgi:hypothetical protein
VFEIRFPSRLRRAVTGVQLSCRPPAWCRPLLRLASPGILIVAVCLALCLPSALTDAEIGQTHHPAKLEAAYTATLLGFSIGQITWTVDIADNRFSTAATGGTMGLFRIFAGGHGVAEAHGSLAGKQPAASDFAVSLVTGNAVDDVKIVFSGGKAKEYLAHPRPPNPQAVPLTDTDRSGVFDPMTALLINVPGKGDTAVPAACERNIPVFDGHMHYDMQLSFKRIEEVKAATGYQGPAVVCALYFNPVAGYDPNRYGIRYLKAERDMEIWLTPLSGTRLVVPFRFTVPTPIGLGVLQATRFIMTEQSGRASVINSE